jgi:transposase-like protein
MPVRRGHHQISRVEERSFCGTSNPSRCDYAPKTRAGEGIGRKGREGHPPRDAAAFFSGGQKVRIVLEGLRGEESIVELCRREGIVQNLYYRWSKDFLEAGKKRLAGDTARAATSDEVKDLRRDAA